MGTAHTSVRIMDRRFLIMRKRKERILYKDTMVIRHPVDGFTLSYRSSVRYFKQWYIFYGVRAAKRLFMGYIWSELQKDFFN